jgi:hypothetical protein
MQTLSVTPGETYAITIGAGGLAFTGDYYKWSANPGENTSFGNLLTALGGLGGRCDEQSSQTTWPQPVVEGSATGGSWYNPLTYGAGEDGQLCPFDLSSFPDLDGKKFGAGGGAGGGDGGETGGGVGSIGYSQGTPSTFYGAGGGGGGYYKVKATDGYQGILIIKY